EGGGAKRLDRRTASNARDADRHPPRGRGHHHHVLRARSRQGDRVAVGRLRSAAAILVLLAASRVAAAPTDPEITVVLTDHHFRLSVPVEPGRLLWHIKNEGSEPHQALVIRLPEGVSEYGEEAWFERGGKGPEPGERAGGIETIAAG